MELSKIKKWIQPALVALPPKRWILITLIVLITMSIAIFPLLNRWVYPLKYEDYIVESAVETGADPYLIMAIIRAETKFDPEGTSHAGAQGLMQLMPATIKQIIDEGNFSPTLEDIAYDPATNIRLGSWYLHYLTEQFNGNKVAAVAAYNAGQGNVKKWLKNKIWDGTLQNADQIPFKETRDYLKKVIFYYEKYKELYGPEIEKKMQEEKAK